MDLGLCKCLSPLYAYSTQNSIRVGRAMIMGYLILDIDRSNSYTNMYNKYKDQVPAYKFPPPAPPPSLNDRSSSRLIMLRNCWV